MSKETNFTRLNKGVFHVSGNLLQDHQLDLTLRIFQALRFIPLKTEFLFASDRLECLGLSPLFRESAVHEITPLYNVIITMKPDPDGGEDTLEVFFHEAKDDLPSPVRFDS